MQDIIFRTIGYAGGLLIGSMQIPQIYHTKKSGKVKDLSIYSVCMNFLAAVAMITYGTYFRLYPVLIANCSVAICDIILFYLYAIYVFSSDDTSGIEMV